MSGTSSEKNSGFTDVEMGPLLGQAKIGERKKKPIGGGADAGPAGKDDPNGPSPTIRPKTKAAENGDGGPHHAASESSSTAAAKLPPSDAAPPKRKGSVRGSGPAESTYAGKVAFACILYSFCSVSMVLTNKSLASSYQHLVTGDMNVLLVVFQAIVAVICVEFCKKMKWVEYPSFDIRTARLWAPVNLFFCGMLFTGMASLQYNNVPMVTVFKNVTNIVVAAGDGYFFKTPVETLVKLSFGIMLAGACLAAKHDIEITFLGLFWMGANCLTTAGYILYMKFATKNVKLSKFGMVFYNNVLCIAFLLPAAFVMGEVKVLINNPAIHTWEYFFKNFFAGFVGFFLNFASLNCVSQTGPSTYAMIGALNKIPIAILGYFLFDSVINAKTWFFIVISMLGGFLYSYAKIQAGRKKSSHNHGS